MWLEMAHKALSKALTITLTHCIDRDVKAIALNLISPINIGFALVSTLARAGSSKFADSLIIAPSIGRANLALHQDGNTSADKINAL